MDNGFDRSDDATKTSCEITSEVGDVVDVIKHDGVDKKSLKEANLDVMKDGVDGDGLGGVKDNENSENMEIVENEEVKEDLLYNEEQKKDAGDSLDGEVNKFAGEPLHVEKKHDEEAEEESEAIDATEVIGEVKDCVEKDNVGVNTEIEENKDFRQTKNEQGEKVVDELKNDGEKVVGEEMCVDNYSVTEGLRDIVDRNTMQSINDVKDSGEKNDQKDEQDDANDGKEKGDDNDVIGDNEKGIEEINVDKDDNVLVRLKDSKYMHEVQEVMDCEQKSEMETKINGETTKVNKIKDLMAMNMKVMNEDAAANERHEEKDNVRSVGYEEENAIEEDDVNRENDGNTENVSLKRKRSRERGNVEGKTKENTDAKEKRESEQNAKDLSISPLSTSRERPVRERKIVERLVEVIEKEPNRTVVIEKGRGTPLKDIPNVAYKLARKKPADLKFLHQTLFGRKGKAIDFKNNLLQFSGFAWHESEEKRRVKIKEKLDKCHKHALLDLANLLDLNVSKGSIKKEEVIVKLLDFMEAPSARTDIIIAEEQSSKSRKRKRDTKSNASKTSKGSPAENSMKKSAKTEDLVNSEEKISKDKENDDDDEVEKDTENGMPDEDDAPKQSESDAKESESLEAEEKGDIEGGDSAKGETVIKNNTKQQSSGNPVVRKERSNSKLSAKLSAKSPVKKTSSKPSKVQKDDGSEKVFTRKKRNVESPKRSKPRQNPKDASSGKKEKSAMVEDRKSGPSKTDLRKTICEILKEVDFNTATFTDILKMLATHYKTDLTSRKPTIKQMIQEELTKMADEDEEGESGEEEDAVKEEATRPTGKKVKA